jgi:uncharacterized protein YyaL (SSP411 family)
LRELPGAAVVGDQLGRLTATVLDAIAAGAPVDATALTFLLRQYVADAAEPLRERVADSLGPALAIALERYVDAESVGERAAWLTLFSDASALSEDDRLRAAACELVPRVLHDVRTVASTSEACVAIDACLTAASLSADERATIVGAIDELERVVGRAYRPGEGVARNPCDPDGARGELEDQVDAAAALLTAHAATGRLPYAMLAEELMQTARRRAWDAAAGGFSSGDAPASAAKPFAANCAAARVLSRLAALHRDDDFRAGAVVAAGADYERDAARVLDYLWSTAEARGAGAAALGHALTDYLNVK